MAWIRSSPATVYWPSMMHESSAREPSMRRTRATSRCARSRAGNTSLPQRNAAGGLVGECESAGRGDQHHAGYRQRLMARTSFTLVMLAIAGAMALLLGIIGIYGVISYAVSQRTREIGIRLALGARKSELKWMFVRSALALGVGGLALRRSRADATDEVAAVWNKPARSSDVHGGAAVLAAAAALASYLPARRATAVDPVEALRAEVIRERNRWAGCEDA